MKALDITALWDLIGLCAKKGVTVGCAESCTGGLIAKYLTDAPGSSAVLQGGFVTYTNELKMSLLGVEKRLIEEHTEVSHPCAAAMAEGARARLGVTVALSSTGYAGPGGGTEADPVGTVYLGISTPTGTQTERLSLSPEMTREQIREAAASRALELLQSYLNKI